MIMMELLQFSFQDFWHFIGVLMMLHAVFGGAFAAIQTIRRGR